MVDGIRTNASLAEMQNIQTLLIQRCVNLAGELAIKTVALEELQAKETKKK